MKGKKARSKPAAVEEHSHLGLLDSSVGRGNMKSKQRNFGWE